MFSCSLPSSWMGNSPLDAIGIIVVPLKLSPTSNPKNGSHQCLATRDGQPLNEDLRRCFGREGECIYVEPVPHQTPGQAVMAFTSSQYQLLLKPDTQLIKRSARYVKGYSDKCIVKRWLILNTQSGWFVKQLPIRF